MNKIQEWLKECKEKSCLTYQQIADELQIDVKSIENHTNGHTFPHFYSFSQYIDFFGRPDWADDDLRVVYDRMKKETKK